MKEGTIIRCIKNKDYSEEITLGKEYTLEEDVKVTIVDDDGDTWQYPIEWFEVVEGKDENKTENGTTSQEN